MSEDPKEVFQVLEKLGQGYAQLTPRTARIWPSRDATSRPTESNYGILMHTS